MKPFSDIARFVPCRRIAPAAMMFCILLGCALGMVPAAGMAAEDEHSSDHQGGSHGSGGYRGGRVGGHSDHEETDHAAGGHSGRSGNDSNAGGSSGGYRGGSSVEKSVLRGGRPPWAREGIPEVELGRLNVARAPRHVLDRAGSEALATFQAQMVEFYGLSAEEAAELLASQYAEVVRYDSPLQNLALYRDLLTFGQTELPGVMPVSQLDLAAIFLGSASDKSIAVSEDTVEALHIILGLDPLDESTRSALAEKADTVRQGILEGHGPVDEHE